MGFELSEIPDDWDVRRLDECVEHGSVTYGIVQPGANDSDGVPMLRVNNFSNGVLHLNEVLRVSPEIESKYSRTRLHGGEVLLTLVGSVGQVAIAPTNVHGWNVARAVGVMRPLEDIGAKWLSICLRSPESQRILGLGANTTVQTTINLKDVKALPIPFPPKGERKAIENIVACLDDKIALLRETNATLEAIAQTIFKSWFVDFDPVRAKAEGREPEGVPSEVADLFPSEFEDSILGEIPKGWRFQQLGLHLTVLETGRRPKGGVGDIQEGVPSIGAESIVRLGQFDYSKTKFVSREFFKAMKTGKLESRDVLLYKDGGKPGIFLPRVSMFGDGFPFEVYGINEHVFRIRTKETLSQSFLYFWLWSDIAMHELKHRGGKAAIPGINQSDVREVPVIIPSKPVLDQFSWIADSLITKILANASQVQSLCDVRDTLLPRLMSGKLRISEAVEALA